MKTNVRRLAVIALTVLGTLAVGEVAMRRNGVEGDHLDREDAEVIGTEAVCIASVALVLNHFLRRLWA